MNAVYVRFFGGEGQARLDLGADLAEKSRFEQVLDDAVFVASYLGEKVSSIMRPSKRLLTAESRYIACDICLLPAEALVGMVGNHWIPAKLSFSQTCGLDRLQPFASL